MESSKCRSPSNAFWCILFQISVSSPFFNLAVHAFLFVFQSFLLEIASFLQ